MLYLYLHVQAIITCFIYKVAKLNKIALLHGIKSVQKRINSPFCEVSSQFDLRYIDSLRKQAYSNIQKILPPKNENFQIKILIFFHISAQNIDCVYSLEPPRRGGSNEYPQSMFLNRNKINNVYPCKPQFYYIKVGFKGVKIL